MQVFVAFLTLFFSILGYVVFISIKANNHWKKKGIPCIKPYLFIGNMLNVVLGRESLGKEVRKVCEKFPNEPLVGFVSFLKPILIVKDPDLVEKILIRDFAHFINRGAELNPDLSPLQTNLFNLTGNKWRAIRSKFSPIFTSGKLKNMFNNMTDIGTDLTKAIENDNMDCVDMFDITGRFAMDTTGLYGFGMNPKSLDNPDIEYVRLGKKALNFGVIDFFKMLIVFFIPYIGNKLKMSFINGEVQNYFVGIIRNTLNERADRNIVRNDFIDLMVQLKKKGTVEIQTKDASDDYLMIEERKFTEKIEMTDDLLIGQAFAFLIAGFDGFASSLTYTFYNLSKNQEIQDKLRDEIIMKIKEHGILNYDTIKDMSYLDMCLKESLRKHSPLEILFRVCSKDYTFPNGLEVKKGQHINIPTSYIQMDPKNFTNPEKYDPERFHPDITQQPCTFLPFGEGPRMCIAMRFAMLQIKFGLVKTIMNYKLELNPKTKEPVEVNTKSLIAIPKDPIYFTLTKLKL